MNTKIKILAVFSLVLTFAFGGLLLREQHQASTLASLNDTLTQDNIDLTSALQGQRQANEDLRRQLDAQNRLPALVMNDVEEMPESFVQLPPARSLEIEEDDAVVAMEAREERDLSPEELAELEERREARRVEIEERRARWEERRQQNRDRVVSATQERREFFEQISLEGLAPEYRESHERLLTVMDEVEGMMAILNDPETDRETQREIRRNFGGMMREVGGLMGTQREILLNDFAQAIGYSGEEARDFIDYIETVNEMTSMGNFMRGGRGRGGPASSD
ncbi:MAG: hypothetical protein JJU29_19190 [Verrucomicrobia bacterium]|nr:hypothetical protein [Verrucomicrobiota bacterium]MCH8513474.1 hypothetical protein [Kiritimatiellia bacterium]